MRQFNFTKREKTIFISLMILGLICMGITFLGDDVYHTRFWSNYLHNTVFFLGIGFISLFVIAAFITAWAGWYVLFKRLFEAYSMFILIGLILLGVIIAGLWGDFHHLYHWADAEAVASDPILKGKASFLNKGWYTIGTLVIVGIWYFVFAVPLRKMSMSEDVSGGASFGHHKKMRWYAAAFLPFAGFSSAAMIWQWIMSIDAHWYSTLFAWYTTVSWFVSALCITILTLIYLKSRGYYEEVTKEHLHDLGKFLFAFSIFWAYLWFSQYMLIWYGNIGEETVYFQTRINEYPVLYYGNLLINFVLPFFILMRNSTKRKYGSLIFVCLAVLFGHWFDFFQMIKPGILHTTHESLHHHAPDGGHEAMSHAHEVLEHGSQFTMGFSIPGFLEIGTFLGFAGLFLYVAFHYLSKASLIPQNDPYLNESMHHHV